MFRYVNSRGRGSSAPSTSALESKRTQTPPPLGGDRRARGRSLRFRSSLRRKGVMVLIGGRMGSQEPTHGAFSHQEPPEESGELPVHRTVGGQRKSRFSEIAQESASRCLLRGGLLSLLEGCGSRPDRRPMARPQRKLGSREHMLGVILRRKLPEGSARVPVNRTVEGHCSGQRPRRGCWDGPSPSRSARAQSQPSGERSVPVPTARDPDQQVNKSPKVRNGPIGRKQALGG